LTETVSVVSPSGTAEGSKAYAQAVQQIPEHWQNSHELHDATVIVNKDNTLSLTAMITYRNVGILPGEAVRANTISYNTLLNQTDSALPVFSKIDIAIGEQIEAYGFEDLYPRNRLLSLVHYWMALVEHPDRDAEPFKEILAPQINIDFGNGNAITSFEQLEEWIKGPASSVEASRHRVHNFSFNEIDSDRYRLQVDLDWHGIRPDGKTMSAKTRHMWSVADEPSERFARVEKINVVLLEPFKVVTD